MLFEVRRWNHFHFGLLITPFNMDSVDVYSELHDCISEKMPFGWKWSWEAPSDVEQVDWHFQGVTLTVIYTSLQGQLVCPRFAVPIHHIPFNYAMKDVYLAVIYSFVNDSHICKYKVFMGKVKYIMYTKYGGKCKRNFAQRVFNYTTLWFLHWTVNTHSCFDIIY